LQRRANPRQRLVVENVLARDADPLGKLHPEVAIARVFAAEEILAFLFDHVLEQHSAQLRHRTFLIANAEEAMNVAELVKLIARPALKLLLRQSAAQQQLAHGMRARVALLQGVLQIRDQLFRSEQSSHKNLRLKAAMKLTAAS